MKTLPLIILFSLVVSACELDSNSSKPNYKADLIGAWRTTESTSTNYLVISQESFQQSIEIDAIDCQSITTNTAYEANALNVIINNGTHEYALIDNKLIIKSNDNTSLVYERYDDAQPGICEAPELDGIWESEGDFTAMRSTFKNNQYRMYYETTELSCFKKGSEWDYIAYNGKIAIKDFEQNSEAGVYEHLFDYTFADGNLALYFIESDPNKLHPEELSIEVESSSSFCEDETSTKKIEAKIKFTSLPENLETYLENLGGDYNVFETKLTFDMDNSGSLSTKDIILGLRSEFKIKADSSLNKTTLATLSAKVVNGRSSYDYQFNLDGFTMSDNMIIFTAKAADLGWIKDVDINTPVNLDSKVMNGVRITEGEDNFRLTSQHADSYPAEKLYTSGVDISLLEDPQGDFQGGSSQEVIVDILSIEITLSE